MGAIAFQITSLTIVYSIVYSDADQRNIIAQRHWPLCGEFTGARRISRTNGQSRGKCFHLMTSSCRFRQLLVSCTTSCHYLNPRWLNVNQTPWNKCQWNLNQITDIFWKINEAENKVCEMATILPRYQCVYMLSSYCKLTPSKTALIAWPAWLPIIRYYVICDNLQTGFVRSVGTFWSLYWVWELYMLPIGAFIDISNAL